MDYEKKYKEALKKAKYYREDIPGRKLENGENILDYIFPELKESEDEKIRKTIIECVKNYGPSTANPQLFKNMLAWLEKQGKETSWKPSKEEMDVLYGLSYITNKLDERKEEVITQLYQDLKREFFNSASFENMFPTNTSAEFEKQGVNKHKFIIGDIISNNNIIYRVDNIVKNCIGQDCYFLVDIESENNGTRYLKLIDSKGKTHNSGETTWLCEQVDAKFEKQGNQKSTKNIMTVWKDMRLEVYQQASGNRYEPNYSDDTTKMFSLNDIDEIIEKMSERNPDDKVQPKFKVGDWVVQGCNILKIQCVGNEYYCFETVGGYVGDMLVSEVDSLYHLWTIQDAKDGDALVTSFEEDNMIVMYHSMCTIDTINVHCCLDNKFICENLGVFDAEDVKPATKEQRDTLMKAIADAGYEWDFEKKELKKIQKKPVWGEEDEEYLQNIVEWIGCLIDDEDCGDMTYKEHKEFYLKRINWLNSLKERIKEK